MARANRPALTRRQAIQYRAVLDCEGADYNYPWPHIAKTTAEANAMCAYFFAKRWKGRNIDIRRLMRIVMRCECAEAAFLFARDLEDAHTRKLQDVVMKHGTAEQKRKFAREIPGASVQWLEAMADIQEIMEM